MDLMAAVFMVSAEARVIGRLLPPTALEFHTSIASAGLLIIASTGVVFSMTTYGPNGAYVR